MSAGKLVVTYALRRDEDPILYDHLARFAKGMQRAGRVRRLISAGFEHERRQLDARCAPVPPSSEGRFGGGDDLLDDLVDARVV